MPRRALALRRSAVVLGAGLLAGLVLTGCGGATPTRTVTAAATGSADPSTTPESSPPDSPLTAGLLPASDLGVDEVHQFSLDGGSSSDHHGPWAPGAGTRPT